MQHATFSVKTTVTDRELGQFEALVSAWDLDREDDEIARDAFDETISAWQSSGKRLPLLWEHSSAAVGFIEPDEMYADDRGLIVGGEVDREIEKGRMAWRMIKSNVAGFSIGYLSEDRPRKGGGRLLTSIDLLEISVTSRPMHPSTRALSWKSATSTESPSDLRARSLRAAREALASTKRSGRAGDYRPPLSREEEETAILGRLRHEYEAERAAAKKAAQAQEKAAAAPAPLPTPHRIWLDQSGHMHSEPLVDPDDLSPGVDGQMRPIPSVNERKRFEREERKRLKRNEQRRRERAEEAERRAAIERYRDEAQKPPAGWSG